MTTAWEAYQELKKRKLNVKFLGTGQTGILLSGNGVPIDAVVSDFMAGEIEYHLDKFSNDTDLVGQIANIQINEALPNCLRGNLQN